MGKKKKKSGLVNMEFIKDPRTFSVEEQKVDIERDLAEWTMQGRMTGNPLELEDMNCEISTDNGKTWERISTFKVIKAQDDYFISEHEANKKTFSQKTMDGLLSYVQKPS